jgi:hypothetical protein
VEIQAAIADLNTPVEEEVMSNKDRYESDRKHQSNADTSRGVPDAKTNSDSTGIILKIFGFVSVAIGAVACYIYYINANYAMKSSPRKTKLKK